MTAADDVVALEQQFLKTEFRADRAFVERSLHPDFREYGRSGRVWTRTDTVEALAANPSLNEEAADVSASQLAEDVILVTYRTAGALRSSLWVRRDGGWQLRFHQATRTTTT